MKVKGLLAVLLFAALLLSGFACGGGGAPGETPTPTAVGGSAEDIAEAAMAAAADIDSYQFDMDMDMTITDDVSGTVTMDMSGAVDEVDQEMQADMQMSMTVPEPTEADMEMYIVGGWVYMKMDMGIAGMPPMWMKYQMTEDMWQEQDIASQQLDLLEDFVDVELLGSDMVSGVDCNKLRVTPDLDRLWAWAQMQEGMEGVPDIGIDLEEVITDFSLVLWVAKGTDFPMKTTLDMTVTIEGETMVMAMTMLMHHINEPVTIQLPRQAADATEVPMP